MNSDTLKQWRSALDLSEAGTASLVGVSVHTVRKGAIGTRTADSTGARLVALLQRLQVECPGLFAALVSEARASAPESTNGARKGRGRGNVSPTLEKPATAPAGPAGAPATQASATPAPPPPWIAAVDALPAWMKAAAPSLKGRVIPK